MDGMFGLGEDAEYVALGVSFLFALLGYLATYIQSIRLTQRENRLERVNRQLREFYGPVFAIVSASKTAFAAFLAKYSDGSYSHLRKAIARDPMCTEAQAYREWMAVVLMPLNLRCWELIVQHADLFDAPNMPPFFLQFVAHVSAYKLIVRRWERGDFSEHFSVVGYPDAITDYVRREFTRLKAEQGLILGIDASVQQKQQEEVIAALAEDISAGGEQKEEVMRSHWHKVSQSHLIRRRPQSTPSGLSNPAVPESDTHSGGGGGGGRGGDGGSSLKHEVVAPGSPLPSLAGLVEAASRRAKSVRGVSAVAADAPTGLTGDG
eukprot:TRINITY_DN2330_c0_g1_i1.p1 TRINITY_DN2330_c0_g1~~TRINITY_DN2330_c0_g1_i1.p1  ORF type:complete len:321 (+),score=117.83 TRINITY_DN2330_c0_g1_i1:186-1148(+)